MNRIKTTILLTLVSCLVANDLLAQRHQGSPKTLAADVVFLNDGTVFYGIIQDVDDSFVTLVADRAWLQTHRPDFYRQHLEDETVLVAKQNERLVQLISEWLEERTDEVGLRLFLEDQLEKAERVATADDKTPDTRFTYLRINRSDVRRTQLQDAARRLIAVVAWKHELADVCTRPAKELFEELEKAGIDPYQESVDFSDEVPAAAQTDEQWAIRKAIVEYDFRDENLQYQGTGDTVFRRGEEANAAALLTQMLQGGMGSNSLQQIGEELGIPEFTRNRNQNQNVQTESWKKQAAEADKEGFRSFSITRLEQNILSPDVKVEWHFFVKQLDGTWTRLTKLTGQANADEQEQARVDALLEEPQIKQVVELFGGLGLGGNQNIERAIRHGVATQTAMQSALEDAQQFLNEYSKSLSAPAIKIPK